MSIRFGIIDMKFLLALKFIFDMYFKMISMDL